MNAPDNFHAFRATGIGGSDCAPALGLSPWKSPLQLYLEKVGEAEPVAESEPMRFGKILEPIVIAEYVRRTGRIVATDQAATQVRDTGRPWMLAHLDGYTLDDGPRVIEAKTARDDRGWGDEGSDDVPQAYLLQVTHNMIVGCAEVADIPVLFGGNDFRIYTVRRNPELVDLVIEGERQFWNAVQRREPPAPQTLAEINLRWREARGGTIELSTDVAQACQRLAELRQQIAGAEAEAEAHEAAIKKALMFMETGTIDGVVAVTWRQAKPSMRFDAKAFREECPSIAKAYEHEQPGSRRFLLKI